jgi:hypothetical protein
VGVAAAGKGDVGALLSLIRQELDSREQQRIQHEEHLNNTIQLLLG